jgi:hypothetical protein
MTVREGCPGWFLDEVVAAPKKGIAGARNVKPEEVPASHIVVGN